MNQYDAYRDFVEAFQRDSTELVKLTPEQLAKHFWQMTSDKQAEFFNALAAEIAPSPAQAPEVVPMTIVRQSADAISQMAMERRQAKAWDAITEPFIDAFLEDYEMCGEDEIGRDACYLPTENDKALIKDAVMGLLHDAEEQARTQEPSAQAQGIGDG